MIVFPQMITSTSLSAYYSCIRSESVVNCVSNPPVIAISVRSGVDQEAKMKTDKSEDTSRQRADKTIG